MQTDKTQFIELALELEVLRFGEFQLKSGRISPYFFNTGLFNTGYAAAKLGRHYATAVAETGLEFDMLFGPAYKGISLVALTAAALAEHHGEDVPFAYDRKEAKGHGEGGQIVGAPIEGRVLIIDDVLVAGTAKGEAVQLIREHGGEPVGVVISLDRQEKGEGSSLSAAQELERKWSVPVHSIVQLEDLIEHLEESDEHGEHLPAMRAYRKRYGVR